MPLRKRRGLLKKNLNLHKKEQLDKKSGKSASGGLNAKGRRSYERENPGSDLKSPSKKVGNPRRASFCARMKGMKEKLTSKKTARDPDSRINKSLREALELLINADKIYKGSPNLKAANVEMSFTLSKFRSGLNALTIQSTLLEIISRLFLWTKVLFHLKCGTFRRT